MREEIYRGAVGVTREDHGKLKPGQVDGLLGPARVLR
jgi:hypothetical protein